MRRIGYRVLEAGNAREAMAVRQEHPGEPDLLFTDLVMSERPTGAEPAEVLRGFESDLKVVLASGYSAQLVQEGNRLSEGVAYLPRHFQNHTLAATLRKSLDPPGSDGIPATSSAPSPDCPKADAASDPSHASSRRDPRASVVVTPGSPPP
ncbi:MAG: hypothetical protein JNL97_08470 [Verrucomicrobiales bacterium]|nr:hypothetical protein [Verrucomicrobiales bacterium]